jgi:DNA-binding MarR family transcriptional regulator
MSDIADVDRANRSGLAVPDGLQYRSEPLAALLDVFALWGSEGFIGSLSRRAGIELDTTSVIAITMLARNGAMRPSVLAARLRVGPSNVSKLSANLIERGLVEKTVDRADARASLLQLSSAGHGVVERLAGAGDQMMGEILANWPSVDQVEFARLLTHFERDALRYADTVTGH